MMGLYEHLHGEEVKSEATKPLIFMVSGSSSQVGKSSVCLGILGSLLKRGIPKDKIAYIKPATQCEKPTLTSKYCLTEAIQAVYAPHIRVQHAHAHDIHMHTYANA